MMLSSELEFSKPHSASGFHAALVPILRKYCLKHTPCRPEPHGRAVNRRACTQPQGA